MDRRIQQGQLAKVIKIKTKIRKLITMTMNKKKKKKRKRRRKRRLPGLSLSKEPKWVKQ